MLKFISIRRAVSMAVTLLLATQSCISQAALSLGGTRVVFESDKRSVSVIVRNPSQDTYAAQAWINTEADDTTTAVPFIASPPLFRLDPGKDQQVQINGLPNALPTDRESLFYFNIQEIPQTNAITTNALNIALRTRIKLFYRPQNLQGSSVARLEELQWSVLEVGGKTRLKVNNPTPFHVSFVRLEVLVNSKSVVLQQPTMATPLSEHTFDLPGMKPMPGMQVVFSAINDYGAYTSPITLPIQTVR